MDGREKKTLGYAYARQGTENTDGVVSTVLTAEAANSNMQADPAGIAPQTFSTQVANGYIAGPSQQAGANFSPRPRQGTVNGYAVPQSVPQSAQTSQVSSPYVQNLPNPMQNQQHVQPQAGIQQQSQQQPNSQMPQQPTALGGVANVQTTAQPMSRTSSQGRSSSQGKPLQQQQQDPRVGGVPQPQQAHSQPSQASAPAASAPTHNGVAVS